MRRFDVDELMQIIRASGKPNIEQSVRFYQQA